MALTDNNTFITQLKPGDTVIEQHISGLRYVSVVESADDDKIVVKRPPNEDKIVYKTASGRIDYPYGTQIPDFFLMQHKFPTSGAPWNPGPVSPDAEDISTDVDNGVECPNGG